MTIIYNNVLYKPDGDLADGILVKDGLYVPYSHPKLIVDPTDDQVDELPEPLLTYQEDEPPVTGMYLGLFHGSGGLDREKGREHFEDWGFNGPLIGPLEHVHTTYKGHIKFRFVRQEDADQFAKFAEVFDKQGELFVGSKGGDVDCLIFNGDLFGDWTVFYCDLKADKPIGVPR